VVAATSDGYLAIAESRQSDLPRSKCYVDNPGPDRNLRSGRSARGLPGTCTPANKEAIGLTVWWCSPSTNAAGELIDRLAHLRSGVIAGFRSLLATKLGD
jgi:hypothetical protein